MKKNTKYILFFSYFLIPIVSIVSCILPVYLPTSGSRLIDTSNIKPGVTTKEDILLSFGYVFNLKDDERIFTFSYWKHGKFAWLLIPPIGANIGTFGEKNITDIYEVEIEFDDNDIVKKCETFKQSHNKSQEPTSTPIKGLGEDEN